MKVSSLCVMTLVTLLVTGSAFGGLWKNLGDAINATVENYNNDMLATGDAVIGSFKGEGPLGGKLNTAFQNYHDKIVVTGDNALTNSKAVYAALKDIAMWLPNQLKKLWDKFVAELQSIRDKLNALNEQLGGSGTAPAPQRRNRPPAEATLDVRGDRATDDVTLDVRGDRATDDVTLGDDSPGAAATSLPAGLGDGFVANFAATDDITVKLSTFYRYWNLVDAMAGHVAPHEDKVRDELLPKLGPVAAECMVIEDVLADQISQSPADLVAFKEFRAAVPAEGSRALANLTDRVVERTRASLLHGFLPDDVGPVLEALTRD